MQVECGVRSKEQIESLSAGRRGITSIRAGSEQRPGRRSRPGAHSLEAGRQSRGWRPTLTLVG